MLIDTPTSAGVPEVYWAEERSKAPPGPARPADLGFRYRTPALTARQRRYQPFRRWVELAIAVCLGLPAFPVILVAAVFVRLSSRGPAFYTQARVGRGGKLFTIYKLRTMIHNCESLTGPRWSMPGDPRITWVGQVLRATHLDELPQLLNVLRGEMSLIGPRPERPEFVRALERAVPGYRDRLLVRPGVTGLAQVQLEADTGLESVRRKLAYDLFYIHRLGPVLDFRILACTGLRIFGVSFHMLRKTFAFPSIAAIEAALRAEAPVESRQVKQAA
jgi:lipopolysaccharide/colanic/teichoic acid biosynthesis glycosyltransferase